MESMRYHMNTQRKNTKEGTDLADFCLDEALKAHEYHKTFHEYDATPLVELAALAADLGVGGVYVKDESRRFGLNAFKVLGGSYAIGRLLTEKLDKKTESIGRDYLCSADVRERLGSLTFATATDGNHGRGVAWTARQLGQNAVVYMPYGSAASRVESIRATGAVCTVTDLNYDDTVRLATAEAEKYGWLVVQDTAWEGYDTVPRWIMQGYLTIAVEAMEQLKKKGVDAPTHLFLQAGVGSFAGAILGFMAATLGDACPVTVVVEPHQANSIYRSMILGDGKPHAVVGELDTLMAGLACGEPSPLGWEVLRDYSSMCISCPDFIAANGMRILGFPLPGDERIVSGESGAVTTGLLDYIMRRDDASEIQRMLGLSKDSRILLISTEGATSPQMYQDIVWYGRYSHSHEE